MRKKWIVIGLALGLSVPVSFVAHPATAATSDAIAQALVTATLQNLGLTEISTELSQQLSGKLTDAIDAGVIDPTISAQVASLLENPALLSGLSDVFNAHLDGETSVWRASDLSKNDSTGAPAESSDGTGSGSGSGDSNEVNSGSNSGSGEDGSDGNGWSGNGGQGDGSGDSSGNQSDSGSSGDTSGQNSGSGGSDNESDNGGSGDNGGDYEDDSFGLPGPVATFPSRIRLVHA